jgi:ABC-type Mn2+/Zn2+ transport system ATPase subunit/ABC-type Zn uptake system ZnuABC Zn-binding protein ZnuA
MFRMTGRRVAGALAATALATAGLTACSSGDDGAPRVLATFTILADIADRVAGDVLTVDSLTRPGAEIHGYDPTPGDIRAAADADLIISNGLGLENWLDKLMSDSDATRVTATDGIDPITIEGTDDPNPHAWMSPTLAADYVDTIAAAFADNFPDDAATFRRNAGEYKAELAEVETTMRDGLAALPANQRALQTCEGAFSYLTREAGMSESYIWPVNSGEEITPRTDPARRRLRPRQGRPRRLLRVHRRPRPQGTAHAGDRGRRRRHPLRRLTHRGQRGRPHLPRPHPLRHPDHHRRPARRRPLMTAPAIDVRGLGVHYGSVHALDDVTLRLDHGRIHGLIGTNGSGKSTLFNTLMGEVRPTTGTVTVADAADHRVAYVPQSESVDWTFPLSVREVVMTGRYGHMGFLRHPRAADRAAVTDALARTDLTDLAGRQIGQLSGGQKKRTFVARGLAQQARTVLLDEPFAGVDTTSQAMITALLHEMADAGACILISTHDLASVDALCDTVTMLHGTVVAHGAPAEVMTTDNLMTTFGMVA